MPTEYLNIKEHLVYLPMKVIDAQMCYKHVKRSALSAWEEGRKERGTTGR